MPTPTRLYKYMRAEHLAKALCEGVFRIGTLYEFRNQERLGSVIGDDGEGKKTTYLSSPEDISFNLRSDDPRAQHARRVIKGVEDFHPAATVILSLQPNASLDLNEESHDVYLYCVTMKYDATQMRAFGYDACLVINNPEAFFMELSNSLRDADFVIGAEVQYGDRRVDYAQQDVAPPAFLKPSSYTGQCEFRAVWEPHTQPIEPVIVRCPRALQYCHAHESPVLPSTGAQMPIDISPLNADELDALIARALERRAQLPPEFPRERPKHVVASMYPAWWTHRVGNDSALEFRHPGMGWVGFVFAPNDRANLLTALLHHALMKESRPEGESKAGSPDPK